jgi:hypothetical protein
MAAMQPRRMLIHTALARKRAIGLFSGPASVRGRLSHLLISRYTVRH